MPARDELGAASASLSSGPTTRRRFDSSCWTPRAASRGGRGRRGARTARRPSAPASGARPPSRPAYARPAEAPRAVRSSRSRRDRCGARPAGAPRRIRWTTVIGRERRRAATGRPPATYGTPRPRETGADQDDATSRSVRSAMPTLRVMPSPSARALAYETTAPPTRQYERERQQRGVVAVAREPEDQRRRRWRRRRPGPASSRGTRPRTADRPDSRAIVPSSMSREDERGDDQGADEELAAREEAASAAVATAERADAR